LLNDEFPQSDIESKKT
jgi:hypothetical protein